MRRLLNALQVIFVLAVVLALLLFLAKLLLPEWFWHPLGYCSGTPYQQMLCKGYNSWSGILGSWITNSPQWIIVVGLLWFHHNCHEPGCWAIVRAGKTHCPTHEEGGDGSR